MKTQIGPNSKSERILQESITNGSQSVNYNGLFRLKENKKVQIKIKRDSYDRQSYAKIELFDGQKWNHLASLPWSETGTKDIFYQTRVADLTTSDIEMISQDVIQLLDLADEIIF